MAEKPTYGELEKRIRVVEEELLRKKDIEMALRDSGNMMSILMNATTDEFLLLNPDGTIIAANESVAKSWGHSSSEIIGKVSFDFFSPQVSKSRREVFRKVVASKKPMRFEDENSGKYYDNSLFPILDDDGHVMYIALFAHNMTEHKQIEIDLRKSRERIRDIAEKANQGIIVYQDDMFKYVNPHVCEVLGYPSAEIINRPFTDFVHPDDLAIINKRHQGRIKGEKFEDITHFRVITKTRETKWVQNKPVLIDWDSTPATLNFISDITERKLAEQAQRESEDKFRLISEQSLMGIGIIQDGVYIYLNDAMSRLSEYSIEEMMRWKAGEFSKLTHPDDLDFVMDQYRKKLAGEKEYITNYTYRGITKSGKTKWIDQYSKSIVYRGKSADLVTVIDITERKQAEEGFQKSEEKYRTLVENSPLGIAVIDKQHNYSYLSSNFIKIFGYTLDDFSTGKEWFKLAFPNKNNRRNAIKNWIDDKNTFKMGESRRRIFDIVCKDGNVKTIDFKPTTLETGEQLIMYEDITERKRSEELMIQTEKMMSVGGLAAGMAHELNNPLGGILQGIQNVQRRLSPDLKSNHESAKEFGINLHNLQSYMDKRGIQSFIDGIIGSGKKASEIILNMLQFSRKSESRLAPNSLAELMENAIELAGKDYNLKKKYDFRNIKIIKEFDSDLPLIPCTETEIEQVILNLLKNAAQAMIIESQKDIHSITIRLLKDQNMARIEIEDSGPGMDEVIRKRIFEPFFTTKPVGEGTGLGLSVSYMIITNNHKGTMEVESEIGKGTKFIIRLPLESELTR